MTMTMWTLYRYYGNDLGRSHWRGNTHLVLAELKDTPPNSPIAFEISRLGADEIRKSEGFIQEAIREGQLEMAPEMGREDATGFLLLIYAHGAYSNNPMSQLMSFHYEGAFSPESVNKQIAQLSKPHQSMICDGQAQDLMKQINAMATGKAQNSMEAAGKGRI